MWKFGLVLLLLPASISAHSWYSFSCCGGQDCHPIDSCSEIQEDKTGYTWSKYHFEPGQVFPSQDNKCHVCVHDSNGSLGQTPTCIYIQEGS